MEDHVARKEMSQDEILSVYDSLRRNGVEIRVDGGWGVDALNVHRSRSAA